MRKKYICMVIAASLIFSSTSAVFAQTGTVQQKDEQTTKSAVVKEAQGVTGAAITTTESAVTVTNEAIKASPSAIETTGSAIQVTKTPEKTETKKLSLAEAIKIMQTTGSSAEAADLHKQSDVAVANGYSETVSKIKKTEDKLDMLDKIPSGMLPPGVDPVQMAYEAQMAGATSNNKKIMQIRRDFARSNTDNNYKAELNQIESDTISIYYKVLLAQDSLKIAKENLITQEKTLKNVEAKKAVGLLSKKDVLQAKSAVADAQSAVRAAETQLKYAKMSFNYLLGFNVQQEVIFTDTIEGITSTAEVNSADDAVKKALDNRIELKGANLAVKVYEILLEDVKAYPKNSSKYLNAKISLAEAEKTAKDAYSKIELDIRNKYDLVQDKKAAVDAAKDLLAYATEGERLMQLTNEEGISTVEELLATQVSLYKAKLNLANANSDYALALKSYEFAQGVGTTRIPL
ncbi:MAG: TolC family protein [Aminipila sp.]